jgi:hypothetical protein
MAIESKSFAQQSFAAVSPHGTAVLPRNTETCSNLLTTLCQSEQQQMRVSAAATIIIHTLKIRGAFEPQRCGKTKIRHQAASR